MAADNRVVVLTNIAKNAAYERKYCEKTLVAREFCFYSCQLTSY